MSSVDDKEYYYQRAESELEMAQRAEVPEAVKAHYTLAGYYLDKVYNDGETALADSMTSRAQPSSSMA
ncbi:hypothetical protein [Sphingomonas jeddahensis]|uniref:Uncharacterized protein n=1 Tax=Sphingomonas jeddahensis TaxID=1915074 RepID=A0A1V2EVY2_9SPHN|nr:hypothetical protein [Sphingomonas jeddahensis]ONF96657.1 hypothetical protein SPHI_08510 [Sphingomonas jeddahensis]